MPASEPAPTAVPAPVRIWDLPTRLFHWLLAAAVVGLVITGRSGEMLWHFRLGYLVLGLLAFRLLWGVVGGHWSRFATFVRGPSTILRYLRGQAGAQERLDVGHNPLGALSVLALLVFLAVQVGTGLVADDEIANQGPLNRFVAGATAGSATAWHKDYGQWILIALVVLHLLALLYYRVLKGKRLVGPMISGDKPLPADTPASRDGAGTRALALLLAAACAGGVAWVVSLGGVW